MAGGTSRRGGRRPGGHPARGTRPGRGGARSGAVLQHRRAAPRPAPAFAPRGPRRGGLGGMERGEPRRERGARSPAAAGRGAASSPPPAAPARPPSLSAAPNAERRCGVTCSGGSHLHAHGGAAVPRRAAPPRPRLPAPQPSPAGGRRPPPGPAAQPRHWPLGFSATDGLNEPGEVRAPLPRKTPVAIFSSLPT